MATTSMFSRILPNGATWNCTGESFALGLLSSGMELQPDGRLLVTLDIGYEYAAGVTPFLSSIPRMDADTYLNHQHRQFIEPARITIGLRGHLANQVLAMAHEGQGSVALEIAGLTCAGLMTDQSSQKAIEYSDTEGRAQGQTWNKFLFNVSGARLYDAFSNAASNAPKRPQSAALPAPTTVDATTQQKLVAAGIAVPNAGIATNVAPIVPIGATPPPPPPPPSSRATWQRSPDGAYVLNPATNGWEPVQAPASF